MADYTVAQASVLIVPKLDGFHTELDKKLKAQKHDLEVEVKAQTAKMVAQIQAAKQLVEQDKIKLQIDDVGITKSITEIRHKYQDLQREMKKALILDLKVTGLDLLPQLTQGLAAANASIVQLSQSATLLPGILSGVLSSISALATGLGGVKGAFKEYSDAQKNAAQSGLQARNAAQNVNNAYRDLNRTVKDAKRSLEDLNAQLRDAPLDEADAIIRVQEARAEAADQAGKSGLQQQKDTLNLIKAENELADTRLRNSRLVEDVATANAKGVAGADAVVDATDRLTKAMDDAATKSTKLTDALGLLSPNAQDFVKSVTGMRDEWMSFRDVVQDKLFEGLGAEVVKLGQNDLPVLQRGFSAIAGEINGNVKVALATLQTDTNKGFLDRIFGNTATAQGNIDKAINPLIDAFLRLSSVGSDFLPRLADGLSDVLTRFDNFIVRAEGDGSLEKWMNNGIDALKDLGNSIINIGSMLSSLNDAFTDSGGQGLLSYLQDATKRVAELMKSTDGQDKLKKFFMETRAELAKWRPLLDDLPRVFKNLSDAARAWSDILLPFLTRSGQLLAQYPGLVQAVFSAFLIWKNVSPVVSGLYGSIKSVKDVLTKLNDEVFGKSQGHIGKFATGVGTAKEKVANLTKAIAAPGLIAVATLAVTWIGENLVKAHDDAAAAARRQKGDVDDLTTSLSDVAGAATNATKSLVAKNFREAVNEATGKSGGNAFAVALPDVNQQNSVVEKVVAGDIAGALSMVPGADAKSIEASPFWSWYVDNLKQKGLTPDQALSSDTIARAVNGEPAAKAEFEDWIKKERIYQGPPGVTDNETLKALENARVIPKTPDLLDIQNQLPEQTRMGSIVQGEIYSNTIGIQQGQANKLADSQAGFGRVQLMPGNDPFTPLGVLVSPALGPNGGELVVSSAPAEGTPLGDQLRNDGVTFNQDGPNRFIVTLDQSASNKYLQRYASGGLISGPGSGTSDSILARLSHGEYVVNAASTAAHKPLLDQINSGGVPGYKVGGPYPMAPAPAPPPPSPVAPLGVDALAAFKPSINSSGATMDAANRPGEFNRTNFQSAGQAQAARRGTDTAAKAAAYNPGSNLFDKFQNAMGTSTYTMRVTTENSAYNALGSPAPESRRRPFDNRTPRKFIDPTAPKNLSEFGSQLFGVPISNNPATKNLPYPTAGAPTVPVAPVAPVSPSIPSSPNQRPVGPAPQGKTWDYASGQWVSAPGTAGAGVPHIPAATPASPGVGNGIAPLPVALTPPVPGQAIPAQVVDGVTAEVNFGAGEAAKYGLRVSSGLRPGETGSYHAIGQAGDYTNQQQFGPPTPEMTAFANEALVRYLPYIDELIYGGVSQNIKDGVLVPAINMPGSPYNDAQAGYHGDHVHIAWKPGALAQLQALAGSPSNMLMAGTPAGVMLPQFTFGPGGSGAGSGNGNSATIADLIKGTVTPEQYAKYVSDAWQQTLSGLVKNAGSIATSFLGSFFGLDFGPLQNIANSVMGGIGGDSSSGGSSSGGAANGDVSSILGGGALPAEYQQIYDQTLASTGDPNQAMAALQQVLSTAQKSGAGSPGGYSATGGAEQWRPVVRQAIAAIGPKYGITNVKAWEDALVRQIQTESNGNPNIDNLNDSNGKGGTQQVFGLGQFLPSTFAAHNVLKGDIHDPVASIYAMVDYVATKYGMDSTGAPNHIGRGVGYATGGKITGMGNGKSDSILARVSNGEYIVKADAASKHLGLLHAINSGTKLPGFVDGGLIPPLIPPPPIVPPPPPPPPPSPVAPDPMGPTAGAEAGQPSAPAPDAAVNAPGDAQSNTLQQVGDVLSSVGQSVGGAATGAEAPAGASPTGDPRSALAAAPQNLDHNLPAVSQGIQAAGSAISSAISTAMSVGSMGASLVSPESGAAAGAASSMISGLVNAGTGAAAGAVNILSSLLVGTATRNGTAGAYGTPLLPDANGQKPYAGPSVVNNWNGGVHTSNNEEFYNIQKRRELQNAAPMLPNR